MALLPFVDSTPRAYRLKASNAGLLFQHSPGQSRTLFSPYITNAGEFIASQLFQYCGDQKGSPGGIACSAYVSGFAEGLLIGKMLREAGLTFCPPKDLSATGETDCRKVDARASEGPQRFGKTRFNSGHDHGLSMPA
jgi:hypothetical protein